MSLVFRVLLLLAAAAPAAADVTDRLARVVPLTPATPVSLRITIGDVEVIGWDRPDLSIEIVRRAPGALQLARIPVQIDTTVDGVIIQALQANDGRDAEYRTDVVIRAPAAVAFRDLALFEGRLDITGLSGTCSAHVERGDVRARNVSGVIRLETGMGNISLEGATLSPGGLIRLRTFNGDVTLGLAARPANARILALSMGGTIMSDIPLNRQERWGPRWGEATVGTGEPLISIDVVNGNIAITTNGSSPKAKHD
jgi:hypothetical protein